MVAVAFVREPIAFVQILGDARAWIDTVFGLELLRKTTHVHRLDVASNGVLHLDPIAGIFERDPLHSISVLSHHERCRGGDGTGSRI